MNPENGGVGGEFFFYELLRGECFDTFRTRFGRFPLDSVLDIGCGDCRALIGMHYQCGSTVLHGFDKKGENEVLSGECLRHVPSTIGEAYEAIARGLYGALNLDGQLRPRLRAMLRAVAYNTTIAEYTPDGTYDAIICSHMLHFMNSREEVEYVLGRITRHRLLDGLVYVSLKDDYQRTDPSVIAGQELLAICCDWAEDMGLVHRLSHNMCGKEGQAHVFTNL